MAKKFITAQFKGLVQKQDEEIYEFIASTADIDRDNESIDPKGWNLDNYMKNPVILWAHNYAELPIGKAARLDRIDNGLKVGIKFASPEANPKAQNVKLLHKEGIQNALSVGYIEQERDGNTITKAELLEISFVPVPANPHALALAYAKGFNKKMAKELIKGVVEQHEPPVADRDLEWDNNRAKDSLKAWAGGPEKENVEFDKYKNGFAWFDSEEPENLGSYKLPHCEVIDGTFSVVWRGVVASMAVLLGARGGVDVPEGDRQGIYNHLAKHYEQFGETPPELRAYTEEELKALFPEEKAQHDDVCDPDSPAYDPEACEKQKTEAKQEGTEVQTLILSKERFTTEEDARQWVRDHDFHAEKVDETENSWRFRQFEPTECEEDSFATINLTEGVDAVICRPDKGKTCNPAKEKSGRVLSAKNRDLISGSITQMKKSIAALEELLEATEPAKEAPVTGGEGDGRAIAQVGEKLYELPLEVVKRLRQQAKEEYENNAQTLSWTKEVIAKHYERSKERNGKTQ